MTNMRETWKHEIEETNSFQRYDDGDVHNIHLFLCLWRSVKT